MPPADRTGVLLLKLHKYAHATLITASADFPLLQSLETPLEVEHAAFVTGLASHARFLMSLRLLDTGAAKDVSGVLRITRGSMMDYEESMENEIEEKEVLYLVSGDGSVKVFERGATL